MEKQAGARLFSNAAILIATRVISKAFGTVFAMVAARKLGVEQYGLLSFAGAFGTVFGMVAIFGLPTLVTRLVAREKDRTGEAFGSVVVLETVLSGIVTAAMVLTVVLLHYPNYRFWVVAIGGSGAILLSLREVVFAFFRAHQRMVFEAYVVLSFSVLNMALGVTLLLAGYGVLELMIMQWAVGVITLALGGFLIARELSPPVFLGNWETHRKILSGASPFALSSVFVYAYANLDVILLSLISGDHATGLYAGAKAFVGVFGFVSAGLVGAFLPALSQVWRTSPETWPIVLHRMMKYLFITALPIAAGLWVMSDSLTLFVLGRQYAKSGLILQVLSVLVLLNFANNGLSNALWSIDREKTHMSIVGALLVFNVCANLGLIPIWGAFGAAAASLLTESVMLLSQMYVLARAGVRPSLLSVVPRPVGATVIMVACVYAVKHLGLVPAMLTGFVVYLAALWVLGTLEGDEIAALRFWWGNRSRKGYAAEDA